MQSSIVEAIEAGHKRDHQPDSNPTCIPCQKPQNKGIPRLFGMFFTTALPRKSSSSTIYCIGRNGMLIFNPGNDSTTGLCICLLS